MRPPSGFSANLVSKACRDRIAHHDTATLTVLANFGLSTQLAALGICLIAGHPGVYLWIPIACGLAFVPLELRRRYLVKQ